MVGKHRKPQGDPGKTLVFILVGACLVVITDLFLMDGKSHIWRNKNNEPTQIEISELQQRHEQYMSEGIKSLQMPRMSIPVESLEEADLQDEVQIEDLTFISPTAGIVQTYEHLKFAPQITEPEPSTEIPKEDNSKNLTYDRPIGQNQIVVIIDDMGVSSYSKEVENLPGPLTLSYLPYAKNLPEHTSYALAQGHELMVHVPMEPMNSTLNGGPAVLKVDQDKTTFIEILEDGLSKFDNYKGINNHMGSRLTQDRDAMEIVMNALKERGLYFVDSKTINTSIAAEVAAEKGLAFAERDVFLDHEQSPDYVTRGLEQLENVSRRRGYAIGIGHPHPNTIAALKKWLPTLKERGFNLVPASSIVRQAPEKIVKNASSAITPASTEDSAYRKPFEIWILPEGAIR